MVRQSIPERSCTGFGLIPVSGVSEAVCEEKIGGHGIEGKFCKDMTDGKMTFGARRMSRATRVITCKARTEKNAHARVR